MYYIIGRPGYFDITYIKITFYVITNHGFSVTCIYNLKALLISYIYITKAKGRQDKKVAWISLLFGHPITKKMTLIGTAFLSLSPREDPTIYSKVGSLAYSKVSRFRAIVGIK